MTGIVILPAGRDDAFEDYKQFIRDGHPIEDIESYLNDEDVELFRTTSDDDDETATQVRVRQRRLRNSTLNERVRRTSEVE
jgi:hypothetical protein